MSPRSGVDSMTLRAARVLPAQAGARPVEKMKLRAVLMSRSWMGREAATNPPPLPRALVRVPTITSGRTSMA